jgi:ubiquinone/menaquinone biosynthesis C-methylase UbiE
MVEREGISGVRMCRQSRIELFDRWAERYDSQVQNASGLFRGYDQVLDQVVRSAGASPGMEVLDLGVGTGNLARRFVALDCAVWGADFSPAMLAKARLKLPQIHLVQMDMLDEAWPEELERRFDRIVSTYVLHEVDLATKIALLRRLVRHHLAAQGRIVVGDVAFESVQALRQAGADHWDEEEHYWAADEILPACERAGLQATYRQISSCGGVFVFERSVG